MPSLETPPQTGAQSPAPITAFVESVLEGGARLLLALLIGLLAARYMRRRGAHWSLGAHRRRRSATDCDRFLAGSPRRLP